MAITLIPDDGLAPRSSHWHVRDQRGWACGAGKRLADLGGPVDMLVMMGVWLAGAIGTLIAVYAAVGLAQSGVRTR